MACSECDSRICGGCDTSISHCKVCDALFNAVNDDDTVCYSCMTKRKLIWGPCSNSDIFDSHRFLDIIMSVTISGLWHDYELFSETKELYRQFPCLKGLTKDDFDEDCVLKKSSPFYWYYTPIPDFIDSECFSYSKYDKMEIGHFTVMLYSNKSKLDMMWG